MENDWRYAVFALNGDGWDKKTSLRDSPEQFRRFVQEDDGIRRLPDTDWIILGGPEPLVTERHLPKNLLQDLLSKRLMGTFELAS